MAIFGFLGYQQAAFTQGLHQRSVARKAGSRPTRPSKHYKQSEGDIEPTIWFRFCCDCGPEVLGGGGPAFCCGGMLPCGGSPALGGPLVPTLIARAGPGPDILTVFLLFSSIALGRY